MQVSNVAWGKVAPVASRLAKQFASLPSYQHLANLVAFLFRPCNRSFKEIYGIFATANRCQCYAHHNFQVQWGRNLVSFNVPPPDSICGEREMTKPAGRGFGSSIWGRADQ